MFYFRLVLEYFSFNGNYNISTDMYFNVTINMVFKCQIDKPVKIYFLSIMIEIFFFLSIAFFP